MSPPRVSAPAARVADWVSLLVGSCLVVWQFLRLHAVLAPTAAPALAVFQTGLPHVPPPGFGWWSWWDQSWYLESALAWARFDTDPALQWYPPGYPMLAAPFVHVTPADPFLIPNLLCMLGALWLFAALASQLLGPARYGRSAGAWIFVATTVLPQRVLWAWVVPWTTTPETVCLLVCLLGTARFLAAARRSHAFWAGLGAAATVAFRPADGAVVGAICAAAACWALVRRWPGTAAAGRIVAAAVAGAALPVLVFGSAYLAVNGPHLGGYLLVSGEFGFEWRLLPLRWITLMIDPKPVFVDGQGLAQAFPWIVSGLAGMAALVARPAGSRVLHAAMAAAVVIDTVLFLCYRDLHPPFLWHNGIYHYFKWTLPFFGLYSLSLLRALVLGPRLVAAASTAGIVLALFMWRLELTDPVPLAVPTGTQTMALPAGLSRIDDALLLRVKPDRATLGAYGAEIHAGERSYRGAYDFWTTAWADTLMVQPLRPMAPVASTLVVPLFYSFDRTIAPVLARQSPVWGLPCWVRPERPACQTGFLVPSPDLAAGQTVRFGSGREGELYILAGVSVGEPEGDWTDGRHATLSFRLPPTTGPLALEVTAYGFVPGAMGPAHVSVFVNGVECARWRFGQQAYTARAVIPAAVVRPDGNVRVDLVVASPRSPAATIPGSADMRDLGIFLETLRAGPSTAFLKPDSNVAPPRL